MFQIHSYTRGCHSDRSLGHLSVTEAELLRDPEGGRQVRLVGPRWAWPKVRRGLGGWHTQAVDRLWVVIKLTIWLAWGMGATSVRLFTLACQCRHECVYGWVWSGP